MNTCCHISAGVCLAAGETHKHCLALRTSRHKARSSVREMLEHSVVENIDVTGHLVF